MQPPSGRTGRISVYPQLGLWKKLPGLDAAEGENLHIVGPATTDDSRVLTDYLAGVPGAQRRTRMVLPASLCRSKPVLLIDMVLANVAQESHGAVEMMKLHDFAMPDAFILDGFFPSLSLWDSTA
ncbi:hypothetical protein NHJ13734_009259 [Beauveria thailandica]